MKLKQFFAGLSLLLSSIWVGAYALTDSGVCYWSNGLIPDVNCHYPWWTVPTFLTAALFGTIGFAMMLAGGPEK